MKKKIIAALMCQLTVIGAYAQLNGNGFYRIQNNTTNKYVSVINNKAGATSEEIKNELIKNTRFTVNALGAKQKNTIVSDPGSIVYLENVSGMKYNIIAQGMNTSVLTGGRTLNIYSPSGTDYYELYASEQGITAYLKDKTTGESGYQTIETAENGNCKYNIRPVDGKTELIGVTPEFDLDGKYYATIKTSFAFQLSEGMKAYYVRNDNIAKDVNAQYAELVEIEGNIVPAEEPVILECTSATAEGNIITPLTGHTTSIKENKLTGTYFCYVTLTSKGAEATTDKAKALKNVVNNNAKTIRVLGKANGKLAFVKASSSYLYLNAYLPANKAYWLLNNVQSEAATDNITLLEPEAYAEAIKEAEPGPQEPKTIEDEESGATYVVEEGSDNAVAITTVKEEEAGEEYEVPTTVTDEEGNTYNVTAIAAETFKDNTTLEKITIPATIESIGESAFKGCSSLEEIHMQNETPINLNKARTRADGSSVFEGVNLETCKLIVPTDAAKAAYQAAPVWSDFKNILTEGELAGIQTIRQNEAYTGSVYNLQGQRVAKTANVSELPRGIYIIDGKKVIKN